MTWESKQFISINYDWAASADLVKFLNIHNVAPDFRIVVASNNIFYLFYRLEEPKS